ncbi:hypothetical protein [Epilithonimonas mollis]|uniref:Uncharacterized protein n=1 Tax=Epilithonimonas mollis TaxID=216903 RepID=A0A1M6QZS4_9FLAO|nr:hypothetical protein [Epilithonimonas mollis]SHK25588.1 hypothetical protein SAMN05444371_1601 [Epilithonimonas mollis]
MEKEMPIINIEGTDFIVDVMKDELREKANPENVMSIAQMQERGFGNGYSFHYDLNLKNFPNDELFDDDGYNGDMVEVKLPELIKIDPERVAEKYNLTLAEVQNKIDFELRIEPNSPLDLRWNKGILPTLDIAGHTFYVDILMDKLRPKDDFKSKGISFTEISDYYDRDRRAYVIPYNPATREFQQDDVFKMTELPKDTIMVQFPHQATLDVVGWYKKHGNSFFRSQFPALHYEARTLPWEETNVIEIIKRNVAEQLMPKDEFKHIYDTPKENLYRIPTDKERVLPTYEIKGTEFIVDVNQLELREKNNPKNVISIRDMDEKMVEGYDFWYSIKSKNVTTFAEKGANKIEIPDFVKLDPIGMAKKHNIPEDKILGMTDFNLMVNQEAFDKIANNYIHPTIDIAGHPFSVDLRNDRLLPKDDIWSRGIIFPEIKYYYSRKDDAYFIPYNTKTRTFQEVSLNVKEIPQDLIVVKIPHSSILDPITYYKGLHENKSDLLKKVGVHLHTEAKVVPWHHTRFAETIQQNKEQAVKAEQKPSILPKPQETKAVNKSIGRKM